MRCTILIWFVNVLGWMEWMKSLCRIFGMNDVVNWQWKVSSGMILFVVVMKNQKRGVRYDYGAPPTFSWGASDGREMKTPDASCLKLVYPLNEETLNPLLSEEPVHFDVK